MAKRGSDMNASWRARCLAATVVLTLSMLTQGIDPTQAHPPERPNSGPEGHVRLLAGGPQGMPGIRDSTYAEAVLVRTTRLPAGRQIQPDRRCPGCESAWRSPRLRHVHGRGGRSATSLRGRRPTPHSRSGGSRTGSGRRRAALERGAAAPCVLPGGCVRLCAGCSRRRR